MPTNNASTPASASPTVAIVGPGAIGTTVAAALSAAGRAPMLCGRTARDHLELREGDRTIVVPGPVRTDPSHVDHRVDVVFLAVKTTQTAAAAPWLAALCRPDTVICILQNGVEQAESVSRVAPHGTVIPSVIWFPAETQADGSVWLRGDPHLTVPDTPAGRTVHETLHGTFCSVDRSQDFVSVAWRKLLQNAVTGLMALTCRRAGIYRRDDIARLSVDYLQECLTVARAAGAVLDDGVPQRIVDDFSTRPADLGTSILADRQAGRPLEWDIRNGIIARAGRAHGVPTPISDVIVPLLAAASDGPG